jgi:hypothetical protein
MRIWCGPFRGARIVLSPRDNLRKSFGLYEHELNAWLEQVLRRVTRVLDVGANDGYFTFGCGAAFQRLGKAGEIIAVENQDQHIVKLRESITIQGLSGAKYQLVQARAGRENKPGLVTLDSLNEPDQRRNTLVKIDVEGAEMDVIAGALSWIHPSNYFVIEVHEERFLGELKAIFAARNHRLAQVNQRPLRLLGRETREQKNWWLVSDLGNGRDASI